MGVRRGEGRGSGDHERGLSVALVTPSHGEASGAMVNSGLSGAAAAAAATTGSQE